MSEPTIGYKLSADQLKAANDTIDAVLRIISGLTIAATVLPAILPFGGKDSIAKVLYALAAFFKAIKDKVLIDGDVDVDDLPAIISGAVLPIFDTLGIRLPSFGKAIAPKVAEQKAAAITGSSATLKSLAQVNLDNIAAGIKLEF